MLGWMLIFALMFLASALLTLGNPAAASLSLKLATIISGSLFLACIATRLARGRA
jgi:hypothetical protein